MNIPASAVPGARNALLASLQATLGDQNLLVCLDSPMPNAADDYIYVGDVSSEVSPYAMVGDLGAGSTQETFTIEIVCGCVRGGDDAVTVFGQAAAYADAVMAAVRTTPNAGGVGIETRPISVEFVSEVGTNGRRTEATVHVRCHNTL